MYYLTKAGVKFISEARQSKKERATAIENNRNISKKSVEALGSTVPPNPGRRGTAEEKRILALQAKMDARAALDIRMGREVT